jgi:putative spermidine/putrescine transport system ATP-binding protein
MSHSVEVRNLSLALGGNQILQDVNLHVAAGSFVTLLGPSGSGKSTTLNVLAGFLDPDEGEVRFGERDVRSLPPGARNLGIVFQNYAIFPHMTVGQNVAFPLKAQRWKGDHAKRVAEMLELVQLGGFERRRASTLSGGQQQRVALARALAVEPRVLLLDEPLSALDKQLREAMQSELKQIQQAVGVTTISVTHDQSEALSMSDLVVVMNGGRIEQAGTAEEMYCRPRTEFLARFLGEVNLFPVDQAGTLVPFGTRVGGSTDQLAAVRPENLRLRPAGTPSASTGPEVEALITSVLFQGGSCRIEASAAHLEEMIVVRMPYDGFGTVPSVGSPVTISISENQVHLMQRGPQPTQSAAGPVLV